MRPRIQSLVLTAALSCALAAAGCRAPVEPIPTNARPESLNINQSLTMQITSPAFGQDQNIPSKYTCDGAETIPPLAFADVPAGAASLALTLDDPDAPSGDFVHWVVFNIPTSTSAFAEGQTPPGIVGRNSIGTNVYVAPCPPSGTHHYQFKLYALDVMLNLDASAAKAEVLKAMQGHIIEQSEMVGLFGR